MDLSLYTGKILAGGAVAAAGTGGVVLYVKNPEWFTSSKTSENEQPTIPGWMTVFNLQEICKDSKTTKNCQLTKEQTEKLGFVLGTEANGENDSVHLNLDASKKVSLQWKEIDGDENNFPFKTLFTIGAGEAALEIQKSGTDATNKISITANSTMQFKLHKKSTGNENKYYFKQLDQTDKEKNAGFNCSNNTSPCARTPDNGSIEGLTNTSQITRNTESDTSNYPNEFKYKVSTASFSEEDGYYKLTWDEANKKWKLEKVEDLFTKWDKASITTGTWAANSDNSAKKITVTVTGAKLNTEQSSDTTFNWECEISVKSGETASDFSLETQTTTLKSNLGIENPQTLLTELIKKQRKIFVENCANNRTSDQKGKIQENSLTENKLQSTITLATETTGGSKNQFKTTDFDNLFKGKVTNA